MHQFRLDGTTPAWVWLLVGVETVVLLGALLIAGMKRHRPAVDRKARVVTGLLVAGLLFAMVVLAFFMIGTYEGSTAFAADRLGWADWRKIIPWGSLDAGAMTFSLFAIRAVLLERDPRRALRIVFCLAGLSALLQLTQGGSGHHWQAGIFLGALALLGSLVLHGIADQIQPSDEAIDAHRKSPSFGIRWMTDLPGTLCAWLAWHNYPPTADIERTVADGLENLRRVRADKLARLLARPTAPRWAMIFPRRYARRLASAVVVESARVAELTAELASEQAARAGEQVASEQVRAELARTAEQAREQAARADAAQVALARAEQAEQVLRADLEQACEQAAEHIRRADAEQQQRTLAEQEAERLRSRLASAARGQAAPKQSTANRPSTSANAPDSDAKPALQDGEIAELLWDEYRNAMASTGEPLTRYRVQNGGDYKCWPRQADRVLEVLASMWAEHAGAHGRPASEHTAEQVLRADPDDQEDSSARAV